MPYKSDKQRRFMHAQHPGIARRWDAEERQEKRQEKRKKGKVRKASTLTEDQIARRKKAQGNIARTTGGLGLASLGAFAAGRAGGAGKFASHAQKAVPALKKIDPKKADKVALGTSTAGAGIGGAGSFNFASYTAAEGEKKVKKNADHFTQENVFGEEGVAKSFEDEVAKKDWTPVAYGASPESKRQGRNDKYESAANAAAAGGGAATGVSAANTGRKALNYRRAKSVDVGDKARPYVKGKQTQAVNSSLKALKGSGKTTALAAGATAAGIGVGEALRNKKKSSWATYGKSAKSAFGITHY